MTKSNKTGITRRDVIKGAGALAGAAIGTGAITGFPYIMAQEKMTLRYLGTAVNQSAVSITSCVGHRSQA